MWRLGARSAFVKLAKRRKWKSRRVIIAITQNAAWPVKVNVFGARSLLHRAIDCACALRRVREVCAGGGSRVVSGPWHRGYVFMLFTLCRYLRRRVSLIKAIFLSLIINMIMLSDYNIVADYYCCVTFMMVTAGTNSPEVPILLVIDVELKRFQCWDSLVSDRHQRLCTHQFGTKL